MPSRNPRVLLLFWLCLAALLALLLWHSWYGPDIWNHLFLGREVLRTASAQPPDSLLLPQPSYVNIYWLFQLAVLGAYSAGGVPAVTLLFAAVWFATFTLWARAARAFEHPGAGLPLALLSVLVCQTRFEERPEVLSWLFLALFLAVLSSPRPLARAEILGLGIAQVAWANVHGYFVLGPALAILKGLTLPASRDDSRPALRRLLILLAALALGSLLTPFGIRTWRSVWELSGLLRSMRVAIEELNPPLGPHLGLWTIRLFWLLWGGTGLAALWALIRRRREIFAVSLAVSGMAVSAASLRNIPLLVVLGGPLWGLVLPALERPKRVRAWIRSAAAGSALTSLLLAAWTAEGGLHRSLRSGARFGIVPYEHVYPARFLEYLRRSGFSGRIFNHPRDGGFLEFHAVRARLYGDSRFADPEPSRRYFEALVSPQSFLALHASVGFDALLLDLSSGQDPLLQLLRLRDWRLAYADLDRAFLVNLASPAGSAAQVAVPVFYAGQDLSVPQEGISAIRWAHALARLEREDLLLLLLRQLAAAPVVPAPVLEHALGYGIRSGNRQLLGAALALCPRMLALSAEEARAVARWRAAAGDAAQYETNPVH